MTDTATLEGYVVDLIRLRKYPADELRRARPAAHAGVRAQRALCRERVRPRLGGRSCRPPRPHGDPTATPLVLDAVRASNREAGIRLRVTREPDGEAMSTTRVEEVTR